MKQNVEKKHVRHQQFTSNEGADSRFLILHNDDVNTFDHVIECLMDVCDHDAVQAEQCAYITHHKGKCDIKRGAYSILDVMRQGLLDRGLQVTID
jgi:ATP-dependent Clp protease adaptor protein ClpS